MNVFREISFLELRKKIISAMMNFFNCALEFPVCTETTHSLKLSTAC